MFNFCGIHISKYFVKNTFKFNRFGLILLLEKRKRKKESNLSQILMNSMKKHILKCCQHRVTVMCIISKHLHLFGLLFGVRGQ